MASQYERKYFPFKPKHEESWSYSSTVNNCGQILKEYCGITKYYTLEEKEEHTLWKSLLYDAMENEEKNGEKHAIPLLLNSEKALCSIFIPGSNFDYLYKPQDF